MCGYQIRVSSISLPIDFSVRPQTMAIGYSNLRKALLKIANVSEKEWRRRGGISHNWAHAVLEAEVLGRKLPPDADQIEIPLPDMMHRLFLLPPTPDSVTCLLAVKWEFVARGDGVQAPDEQQDASYVPRVFRVFLIPPKANRSATPTVVRFDEREENKPWRFAHAQVCDKITPYEKHFPPRHPDSWVSARLPRIPLAASEGPAPVLVCLLASLYGVDSPVLTQVLRELHDEGSRKVAKALGWRE